MSDVHYSWRQYQPGDEVAINDIYRQVKGVVRSREEWAWQWLETPAGPGDMWLIEATRAYGESEIIGHHGMMPMRFTWGEKDLLIGRTENTMVLPEFRKRISYPRFENRFIKEYEDRYDAFFTGSGPVEALRQRRAMGYKNVGQWQTLRSSIPLLGVMTQFNNSIRARLIGNKELVRSKVSLDIPRNMRLPTGVSIISSREAISETFFEGYWKRSRAHNGVAQRRDAEDLCWRFWTNPYTEHCAVIISDVNLGDSLFIFSYRTRRAVDLVDFSFEKPSLEVIGRAVPMALSAIHKLGVRVITSNFVDDVMEESFLACYRSKFNGSLLTTIRSMRHKKERPLPRRLTAKGVGSGLSLDSWEITPLSGYEGR